MRTIEKIAIAPIVIGLVLLILLAPIIPQGRTDYDVHRPPTEIVDIICHGPYTCGPATLYFGTGYASISYTLFGVGEYYYVYEYNLGGPNILTFIS